MRTVTSIFKSQYRVKNSKFLGFLCPASSTSDAERCLLTVREKHPKATHHCYAYLIHPNNPLEYSSDDGEPGGTAGLPILNSLKSHSLMNVTAIVVRYYGGTKLGKSGLIDAYQTATLQTIEKSTLKKLIPIKVYRLQYDYPHQSLIDKWKNRFSLIDIDSSYQEKVTFTLGCAVEQSVRFEKMLYSQQHLLKEVKFVENSFFVEN